MHGGNVEWCTSQYIRYIQWRVLIQLGHTIYQRFHNPCFYVTRWYMTKYDQKYYERLMWEAVDIYLLKKTMCRHKSKDKNKETYQVVAPWQCDVMQYHQYFPMPQSSLVYCLLTIIVTYLNSVPSTIHLWSYQIVALAPVADTEHVNDDTVSLATIMMAVWMVRMTYWLPNETLLVCCSKSKNYGRLRTRLSLIYVGCLSKGDFTHTFVVVVRSDIQQLLLE